MTTNTGETNMETNTETNTDKAAAWENLATMMRLAVTTGHEAGYALAKWTHVHPGDPARDQALWDAKIDAQREADEAVQAAWRCFYDLASK